MPDLNDWRLQYGATSFDFGTLASGYPFKVQVDVGDIDIETQDGRHPTSDGEIMGFDTLGGFDLTFGLTTLPTYPVPAKPWSAPLDAVSAFQAKWRADSIRRSPGAYATLLNLDRNRLVYGRPRKFAPDLAKARKGIAAYVATFRSNNPNFYSGTEKVSTITPVPGSSGGIKGPLVSPLTVVGSTLDVSAPVNAGDLSTWPQVEFHGPTSGPCSLELLSGASTLWMLTVPDGLKFDQVLTVDTRPWNRSATINGAPANGRITGTQIEKCMLPVGTHQFRFKTTDRTGTSYAVMRWRDAYASL